MHLAHLWTYFGQFVCYWANVHCCKCFSSHLVILNSGQLNTNAWSSREAPSCLSGWRRSFQRLTQTKVLRKEKATFYKNRQSPASFLFIFSLFLKNTLQFLQQINVKNVHPESHCWDLNPRPSKHEFHSITTKPGHTPKEENTSTVKFNQSNIKVALLYRERELNTMI